jgi:hypothetical protein
MFLLGIAMLQGLQGLSFAARRTHGGA